MCITNTKLYKPPNINLIMYLILNKIHKPLF